MSLLNAQCETHSFHRTISNVNLNPLYLSHTVVVCNAVFGFFSTTENWIPKFIRANPVRWKFYQLYLSVQTRHSARSIRIYLELSNQSYSVRMTERKSLQHRRKNKLIEPMHCYFSILTVLQFRIECIVATPTRCVFDAKTIFSISMEHRSRSRIEVRVQNVIATWIPISPYCMAVKCHTMNSINSLLDLVKLSLIRLVSEFTAPVHTWGM